jgi:peptidoglycan/LPS O-acetylase OafA/YrhL
LKITVINFVRLFIYFYAGSLYRKYFVDRGTPIIIVLITTSGFVISRGTVFFETATLLFIVSVVFWFGLMQHKWFGKKRKQFSKNLFRGNDYSYGLYLYGYIGQNIIQKFTFCTIPLIFKIPLSIALAFVFAFFSWHVIEKKAMMFKRKV